MCRVFRPSILHHKTQVGGDRQLKQVAAQEAGREEEDFKVLDLTRASFQSNLHEAQEFLWGKLEKDMTVSDVQKVLEDKNKKAKNEPSTP